MALVPISQTHVALMGDIPFCNDYKHTPWFKTVADQKAYYDTYFYKNAQYTESNVQRDNGATYIKVNMNISNLRNVNYLYFYNHNGVDYDKRYYAFVTKLEYVNVGVTRVHFEIDVIQTYMFDIEFKPSYIVREHAKQYEGGDIFDPTLNTVDEGLDYGSELETYDWQQIILNEGVMFMILVAKKPLHDIEGSSTNEDETTNARPTSSINATPQPLTYYIVPYTKGNNVIKVLDIESREHEVSQATEVLDYMMNAEDMVNQLAAMYSTEYFGVPIKNLTRTSENDISTFLIEWDDDGGRTELTPRKVGEITVLHANKIEKYKPMSVSQGVSKNLGFPVHSESKMYMYPYSQIILDDYKGSRQVYHPEYITTDNIHLIVRGSLGTSNNISWSIAGYNLNTSKHEDWNTSNIQHETAMINKNPQEIPVVSDYLSAYLQGNRNTIQVQRNQAGFNGAMSAFQGAAGAFTGMATRGPMGIGYASESVSNGVRGLGNSIFQIQGIDAKIKDANNMPPTINSMGTNTAYDIGNGLIGCFIIWKTAKFEFRRRLTSYFNAFGYKCNRIKKPNIATRSLFNYIQMLEPNIVGSIPGEAMAEIKKVFTDGITLWHEPILMYEYDLLNSEV